MHVHVLIFNVQRAITLKVGKPELWFTCSASRLLVCYIYVKFCENMERTRVHSKKMAIFNIYYVQRAAKNRLTRITFFFLFCTCCLMVGYICEKFHDNISNAFHNTKRTRVHGRNGYIQCSKVNYSKSRPTGVWVLHPTS